MECEFFGRCGSCTLHSLSYKEQFNIKYKELKELFEPLNAKGWEPFYSIEKHYRNRAEFRIWHEKDRISYAMYGFDKRPVLIDKCPKADEAINSLMPQLLKEIKKSEVLKKALFGAEFLSATEGVLVTLTYHKKLDDSWEKEAKALEEKLNIFLVGRSRGIKKVLSSDGVWDSLHVKNRVYKYYLQEGAFSQPNRSVNSQMIGWVLEQLLKSDCKDLLELYCGHGNFTLPLSGSFEKVLATEISKASISAALKNCEVNKVNNITFVRLSAQELTEALDKKRVFRRLEGVDLDGFNFSHLLVDPPRAGMDEKSCAFASRFKNIIYISCNPKTLLRDIEKLSKTHKIVANALFDQFPYTNHLECGTLMSRVEK